MFLQLAQLSPVGCPVLLDQEYEDSGSIFAWESAQDQWFALSEVDGGVEERAAALGNMDFHLGLLARAGYDVLPHL